MTQNSKIEAALLEYQQVTRDLDADEACHAPSFRNHLAKHGLTIADAEPGDKEVGIASEVWFREAHRYMGFDLDKLHPFSESSDRVRGFWPAVVRAVLIAARKVELDG